MPTPGPDRWPMAVIRFLEGDLPTSDGHDGWDHMFSSAYQMGCDALVALGHAESNPVGAVRRKQPQLPATLPRWDDICVAVLGLGQQQGGLLYFAGEEVEKSLVARGFRRPSPNIVPAWGLGAAYAAPDFLEALDALGLVEGGAWTGRAELVLWREQPREWQMDVASDPRFAEAVDRACGTIPPSIVAEFDRLATILPAEIEAAAAGHERRRKEMREEYGPRAIIYDSLSPEHVMYILEGQRANDCDWIFFRRWRMLEGWLTEQEALRALDIFHDPLARDVRKAVMARICPHAAFLTRH